MPVVDAFDDPVRFRATVAELLARDPVGATMVSGVLDNRIADPPVGGSSPLLIAVRDGDGIAVAALRTPGHPLLVTADPELRDRSAALRTLVAGLLELGAPVTGLHGRREIVRPLAQAWADATGARPEPRLWLLLHRLGRLIEPAAVAGRDRPFDPHDPAQVDLLAGWFARFQQETGVARGPVEPDPDGLRRLVRRGDRFTLRVLDRDTGTETGTVVAVAGHSRVRADGGCRIAPVYTPPAWRRRRFGAAVTVAAVRSAWAAGAAEVTLFTDEDYRPANDLYRSLGFVPIAEFAEIDLPG